MQAIFFFFTAHNVLLTPLPFQFSFPPQFFLIPSSTILLFSLFDVFIPSSTIFIIFSPQCFLFPSSTSTSTSSFLLFLSTTTTATFLLFSRHLHHHQHLCHISIVYSPTEARSGGSITTES